MEELVENFNSFEYSGNLLHSNDDTNDSDDEEANEYQAITLEKGWREGSRWAWTNWFRNW